MAPDDHVLAPDDHVLARNDHVLARNDDQRRYWRAATINARAS
jgi:hypothetical protein